LIGFLATWIRRRSVNRRWCLQHIDFIHLALGLGQFAHQFESVLKNLCGWPTFKPPPRGIRRKL
jgi:hypothetical protein